MGELQSYTARLGALFIQPDGPGTKPIYVGCHDADDLEENRGDLELIQCFNDLGEYVTKGFTQAAPDVVTTTLTTYISKTRDWLEKLRCPATAFFHLRCDGKASVFANYERSYIVEIGAITGITRSGLLMRNEDTVSEHAFAVAGLPPVWPVAAWTALRQTTSETEALNSLAASDITRCQGPCGAAKDVCDDLITVGDAAAASPANVANVLSTSTGGGTWSAAAANPFAAGENISASAYFSVGRNTDRWLVARGTTDVANPAEVAYSDDDGATWTNVNVGTVNGQFVSGTHALFALNMYNIWLATNDGYIYYSEDGGASWTVQESGSIHSGIYHAVHFTDENYGYAVGASDVIAFTNDGGTTWAAVTATGGGDNILDVFAHTQNFLLVTTSGGDIYISFDGGTTWTLRTFSGSGTGSVPAIDFLNKYMGAMVHTVSAVSTLFTTIDGGYTWEAMTTPTNTGLNDVHMCATDLLFAVGEASGGTAVIVKATS